MERYSAVTEYLFDCRADREPSIEDIVFCRETGWKEDEEAVEARDGVCNITDIGQVRCGMVDEARRRSWPLKSRQQRNSKKWPDSVNKEQVDCFNSSAQGQSIYLEEDS